MSLVNLPERFLYDRLPSALLSLDERGLIAAVVGGYQDRLEDIRAYGQKFALLFNPGAFPDTGPNVVFVDYSTDAGKVVTRSLNVTTATPTSAADLLAWCATQLNVDASTLANPRLGVDLLRLVDANVLDYIATTIGAVLYQSAVYQAQPDVVTSTGTWTAQQQASQALVTSYFPRLKFKGTARSFEALGKLMGFDDIRMVPLWGRVSPRLPNDPGSPVNDPDFGQVPEFYPQQELDPFYDPHNQRDGAFYGWFGTVANGTSAANYWSSVINGFQPWVAFVPDTTSIQLGTLSLPAAGTYALAGGGPHAQARVTVPGAGTFVALGEGDSWNGIAVEVTELEGTLRRLDIADQLSAVKYRTSFFDLGVTMDADKADEVFGTLAARANADIAAAPHAYVSYSGTLTGTSPFRGFSGGTAALSPTTGVATSDFLTPFQGTISYYVERVEATVQNAQQDYASLASAGQAVSQALEEVRPATRQPRRAVYGYLQDDSVGYAPVTAGEAVLWAGPGQTVSAAGTFYEAPLPPYTTGASLWTGTASYEAANTTDTRTPGRVLHTLVNGDGTLSGFTVPTAGSYSLTFTNTSAFDGTATVEFFGTYADSPYNSHEVVRTDAYFGTQVFAVIGDYGLAANFGGTNPAQRVADRVHSWSPEIIVTVGDNNYYNGAPDTIAANNAGYLADIQQGRMFPTLGNHDLDTDMGQTQSTFFFNGTVPGPAQGRYYSVRRGHVEFFVINSGWRSSDIVGATGVYNYTPTLEPDGNTYDSVQGQWLKAALGRSTAPWRIVCVHEPPYCSSTSSGNYAPGYPRLRWPFREWGATAVMSGHNHAYERLLVDGLTYIVCGWSGETNREFDNVYISPGSVVRYALTPGPTNYGAVRIVATSEFIRFEALNANTDLPSVDVFQIDAPDRRYSDRPEDDLDDSFQFETLDEYPYRRDLLVGGETVESNFYTSSAAVEQYSIFEQTMAVKDQTQVDYDVFVVKGAPVPRFVIRPKALPYQPGQRAICFSGQFRDQALLTPEDLDQTVLTGGRTRYFHSELDSAFQSGYALYHAGLVGGALVADADKFSNDHHTAGLRGWLPFDEHPDDRLTVRDAAMSTAYQALSGVEAGDRLWDSEQGFSLSLNVGSSVTATAPRLVGDDLTLSFWLSTSITGGAATSEPLIQFGNVRFVVDWSGPTINAQCYQQDLGWASVGAGYTLTAGAWAFAYLRKQGDAVAIGFGNLTGAQPEQSAVLAQVLPNDGCDTLIVGQNSRGPWQIRDLRLWNVCKTPADMALVRYHAPHPTVVPYRVGHVLALNSGDRYGLRLLPNGWLTPSAMPAFVISPKMAKVVRYTSEGEFAGEPGRKEVGLGGGQFLPNPWHLGEQGYSMTANGTVAVSTQQGAMPGSNPLWRQDATGAPGFYIVAAGSVSTGTLSVVAASGSGADYWPNRMEATNPCVDTVWLDGAALYQAGLEAPAQFVTAVSYESNQQQGDAGAYMAAPGHLLTISDAGSVVQVISAGTVTTPPLWLYQHETLLERVAGADTLARWTDPTPFGQSVGAPALKDAGELSFTNSSVLTPGIYKLIVDLGNVGKPDDDFDGYRLSITLADTTYTETLLSGYSGNNLRGQQELTLNFADSISGGDWLLTFDWLNPFRDTSRGVARQLAIYGYELRRLETTLFQVAFHPNGSTPDLVQVDPASASLNPLSLSFYGSIAGGWLVTVNGYGSVCQVAHESVVYPENDTLRSRYPLANVLTALTAERREDIINSGTFCLAEDQEVPIQLEP